jgi:hypothetical protein
MFIFCYMEVFHFLLVKLEVKETSNLALEFPDTFPIAKYLINTSL